MTGIRHRFVETNGIRLHVLPGCGHWTQQERAKDVSAAMVDFLKGL